MLNLTNYQVWELPEREEIFSRQLLATVAKTWPTNKTISVILFSELSRLGLGLVDKEVFGKFNRVLIEKSESKTKHT